MPLQLCHLDHAIAQRRQVLAYPTNGALQPTIVRAIRLAKRQHFARWSAVDLQHRGQLRLPVADHLLADLALIADIARFIKHLPLKMVGQVLLRHPVVAVGMRVEIARAVAKTLGIAAGVFEMVGHIALTFIFHCAQSIKKRKDRIRFRSSSQIKSSLGKRKAPLR